MLLVQVTIFENHCSNIHAFSFWWLLSLYSGMLCVANNFVPPWRISWGYLRFQLCWTVPCKTQAARDPIHLGIYHVPFWCLLRNCRNPLNTQSRNAGELKSLKDESLRLNAQHHVCHGVSAESNSVGVSEVPQNWVPINYCSNLNIAHSYWLLHSPVSLTLFFSFLPPESCSYKLPAPVFCPRFCFQANLNTNTFPDF